MSFTEGSIGGDIERIDLEEAAGFLFARHANVGIAARAMHVAGRVQRDESRPGRTELRSRPKLTADGHALLLINPHTSFYFRSELQMSSDEGLNAYGAATWGQFFIYQGFNAHVGWMHTSSGVDNVDEFAETVVAARPAIATATARPAGRCVRGRSRSATAPPTGMLASRSFTVYRPTTARSSARENGNWIAFAMMDRPVEALQQSFLRTKASDLRHSCAVVRAEGQQLQQRGGRRRQGQHRRILHPQFMPRRDKIRLNASRSTAAIRRRTGMGLHSVDELPNLDRPARAAGSYNSNDWPWPAAGAIQPKPADFPALSRHGRRELRGRSTRRAC